MYLKCYGNESCLYFSEVTKKYEKNKFITCYNNCQPIPCYNYIICSNYITKWNSKNINNKYVCPECEAKLYFTNNYLLQFNNYNECKFCYKESKCIFKYDNYICYKCYKIYYDNIL